ncbi:hypothetical protein PPERSA_06839 [Pseudocohnilembus persalinus]|uniref:Uncharacterized protein n=1 Tax=Pseudocohnilembus persalinus TaxID=266149 RepID=A0A0V0QTH1_PSEPJ|nr:hypothetical protein PPERSA_06839 [Pseudocohnilembus persalinus]|eukprot:KRX05205.1 hypothetical protein PPERSA_06839 [Pseudocohnilembus persalinus]
MRKQLGTFISKHHNWPILNKIQQIIERRRQAKMNWGYIRYVVQNFNKLLMNPNLYKLKRELLFYNHANDEILEDFENEEYNGQNIKRATSQHQINSPQEQEKPTNLSNRLKQQQEKGIYYSYNTLFDGQVSSKRQLKKQEEVFNDGQQEANIFQNIKKKSSKEDKSQQQKQKQEQQNTKQEKIGQHLQEQNSQHNDIQVQEGMSYPLSGRGMLSTERDLIRKLTKTGLISKNDDNEQ